MSKGIADKVFKVSTIGKTHYVVIARFVCCAEINVLL